MADTRRDVRDHLERLRRGHAILRDLRLRQLRTLSIDEARVQYDALVRTSEAQRADLGEALERRAIEQRVALRRRLAGRRAHVRRWVNEFSQLTGDREIAARFERAWDSRPR